MDTDAMTAYYWKNLKDIPQRQLADNDEYHALIQKKIAAENTLKVLISEEAWRRYLELDAIRFRTLGTGYGEDEIKAVLEIHARFWSQHQESDVLENQEGSALLA